MIHFSFAPLGLMEKLIALLSGTQATLPHSQPTLLFLTHPLHTFTLSVCSLFISSFLFSDYVGKRNTSGYTRWKQRNVLPIFNVFCLSLSFFLQKPSLRTYFVAGTVPCQMGHNVSEQMDSLHGQLSFQWRSDNFNHRQNVIK